LDEKGGKKGNRIGEGGRSDRATAICFIAWDVERRRFFSTAKRETVEGAAFILAREEKEKTSEVTATGGIAQEGKEEGRFAWSSNDSRKRGGGR